LQQEQKTPHSPITISQAKKLSGEHTSLLAYEDTSNTVQKLSEQDLASEFGSINGQELAISASLMTDETTPAQYLAEPANADEALSSPTPWTKNTRH
jgi:hypothetical protein